MIFPTLNAMKFSENYSIIGDEVEVRAKQVIRTILGP